VAGAVAKMLHSIPIAATASPRSNQNQAMLFFDGPTDQQGVSHEDILP
jgi:hypothetical protein